MASIYTQTWSWR